jgi:predicted flap endonuclease-1-like 5' DNA nuclease
MVIKSPKAETAADCRTLEQLPNIGPALAADLRSIGVVHPRELAARDAFAQGRHHAAGDEDELGHGLQHPFRHEASRMLFW